jgi:tetratricopeptide (TPR) repeat protein
MGAVPTPDEDVALAERALAHGDLGHAVLHAAGSLSADPTHPERLALLDAILRKADDPLALTELGDETSFVEASARAYALALLGHWVEALALVSQVVHARPDVPYLAWSVRWMQRPGVAAALQPEEAIFPGVFAPLLRGLPVRLAPDAPERTNVQHARALAAVLREAHPRIPGLYYAGSAMSRRLALYDEAIQLAARARALEPSYMTAIGHACALRDAGRVDEAVQAYKDAIPFDPDDVAVWLDIGDLYAKRSRWAEALAAYEAALAKNPGHAWAYPSALWVRHFLGDADAGTRLADLARTHPDNDRARALAEALGACAGRRRS